MAARAETASRRDLTTWVRLSALVATVIGGLLIVRFTPVGTVLSEEGVTALLEDVRHAWWAPGALIGLYVLVSVIGLPPAPLLVGGAVFGAATGFGYNVGGLFVGAMASYLLGRSLGRDAIVRFTGPRIRRVERLLARHGFWPLVQTRFLPVPFALVNYGAAMAGLRPSRFLFATVIGLIPSTWIHTFFLAKLIATSGERRPTVLVTYLGTFALFNLLISSLWLRERSRRRRRHRELLAFRASRRAAVASNRP